MASGRWIASRRPNPAFVGTGKTSGIGSGAMGNTHYMPETRPKPNMVFFYGSVVVVLIVWLPIAIWFKVGPLVAGIVAAALVAAILIPWAIRERRRLTRRD